MRQKFKPIVQSTHIINKVISNRILSNLGDIEKHWDKQVQHMIPLLWFSGYNNALSISSAAF